MRLSTLTALLHFLVDVLQDTGAVVAGVECGDRHARHSRAVVLDQRLVPDSVPGSDRLDHRFVQLLCENTKISTLHIIIILSYSRCTCNNTSRNKALRTRLLKKSRMPCIIVFFSMKMH